MNLPYNVEPLITISQDEMEAYIILPDNMGEVEYTVQNILDFLNAHRVCFGIRQSEVEQMVKQRIYGTEILIAKGIESVDGTDGFFEFNFNLDLNKKPEVRGDGSVDYWNFHAIEIVEEGQEIAIYHEPTPGTDGMTVTGKTILAKKGRPQPPLTGRGFERSEDNRVYTASTSGKIDKQGSRILISSIYEIQGDVGLNTGNIDFRGDVIIHGNVTAGAVIRATGSITVDGTSEACRIEAGKDIILRGGVLGANKGVVQSKGNIYAKFFEYATIVAEGSIEATSALCSNITSYDKITMKGKLANIIGGTVYGVSGVESSSLGNNNEIDTFVQTGVSKEMLTAFAEAEDKLKTEVELAEKIKITLQKMDELIKDKKMEMNDERHVSLLRAKIAKQADVSKAAERKEYYRRILERGNGATVKVFRKAFPGVQVSVNTSTARVQDFQDAVEFIERAGKVIMLSLSGKGK